MYEYLCGKKVSKELFENYRNALLKAFAHEYDVLTNRLWNCLKREKVCLEYEEIKKLGVPNSVLFYLERQEEIFDTSFGDVCRYIEQLEPWEYIDAYVFDDTLEWLIAITHEELRCLIVGLPQK